MKLFTSSTTPFGRKVMVLILESGLSDRVEFCSVSGTPINSGTMPLDQNPLGKIPALIAQEGEAAIYDSRVICRYLDALCAGGLYPTDKGLWPVLTLEATADGILDAAVLMVYESRLRPEALQYAPWVDAQWNKVSRALDAIEARWMGLLAAPVTMAHIAVGVALGYLDFRHSARDWRQGRPQLAQWEATFATRPAMVQTRPV